MFKIEVDESEIANMIREQVSKVVQQIDNELVYWDTAELKRRTCMSWNTIQDNFFFDPRFPKHKVGTKWYYPVRELRIFLEQWIKEQT